MESRNLLISLKFYLKLLGILYLTGANGQKRTLAILGFQPLENNVLAGYGQTSRAGALLAIEDINNRTDILGDYNLQIIFKNTEVNLEN